MVDTHAHISNDNNINNLIKEALDNNINKIITCACDKKSMIEGINLITKYDILYLSLGFHPSEAEIVKEEDLSYLENILKEKNKKIVAIGEIGLDYHYTPLNKDKQKKLFIKQLELAIKYDLPVIIHTRDSIQDTYDILKEYPVVGVIHCFSGSLELAKEFIKLGYYLGIGGVVTFKNSKLKDIIKVIGLNNIVLETDSPYLSPIRGDENSPKNIKIIASFIADNNNITVEEVEKITNNNVLNIFEI